MLDLLKDHVQPYFFLHLEDLIWTDKKTLPQL